MRRASAPPSLRRTITTYSPMMTAIQRTAMARAIHLPVRGVLGRAGDGSGGAAWSGCGEPPGFVLGGDIREL